MSELRAGVGRANITPYVGAFLAGFGGRDHGCEGVHDELHAKALVVASGETAAAIVACDLIGLTADSIAAVRERVEKATGIPGGHVMVACTHTHSGPTTGVLRHPGLDAELVHVTERKIAGAVEIAWRSMGEASLGSGKGRARIGVNRRERKPEGNVAIGKNPEGPIDPDVGVVRVDGADGRPMAVVLNHACHPVVFGGGNYLVSADYPGQAARMVESVYPGCTCLCLTGACGDVNPIVVGGTEEDVRRLGTFLGSEAVKVVETVRPAAEAAVAVAGAVAEAPVASLPSAEEARDTIEKQTRLLDEQLERGEITRERYDCDWQRGWARDVMSEYGKVDRLRARELELQAVRLGDAVVLGIPGEVFVEIGLAVKAASPFPRTLVTECTNGNVGYIQTAAAFEEGGYEVEAAHKFYYGVYQLTAAVEKAVTDAAAGLIRGLA